MSEKKLYHVFDLGPGDGGKGGVVHKLTTHHNAHTVLKVGGAQGSHGVSNGRQEFAFSQWGCGTLEGVKTHITPLMVASPEGLLNEADALRYVGILNAFELLTIDELTICATPYHGIASRIKELALCDNPRGTVGTGIGQAYKDSISKPALVIRAKDLKYSLKHRLSEIRDAKIAELDKLVKEAEFLEQDELELKHDMRMLKDDGFLDYNINLFKQIGKLANIVDHDYMSREILSRRGTIVLESSHGILTDNKFGFYPHVSAIRTLPVFANKMLINNGYDGEIINIGVHRAYSIRHGAGPLPSSNPDAVNELLPNSHKETNRYQGKVRVGPLDLVLLRYACEICNRRNIDCLAITWFDQIVKQNEWKICHQYLTSSEELFSDGNSIRTFDGDNDSGLSDYQNLLCSELFKCIPIIKKHKLPETIERQFAMCNDLFQCELGIPVNLVSFGPTEKDKVMRSN